MMGTGNIYINKLEKVGGDLIFESNICENDFNKIQCKESNFLSGIVQSWSNIYFNNNPESIKK